jgi:hypothetical protein
MAPVENGPVEQDEFFVFCRERDLDHGYQDSHKNRKTCSECKAREDSEARSGAEEDTDAPKGDEAHSTRTGETLYE